MVKRGLCSGRMACRFLLLARTTFSYRGRPPSSRQQRLARRLRVLSEAHPRYGYRRIAALLRREGWTIGKRQVQRLRRANGLRVPPTRLLLDKGYDYKEVRTILQAHGLIAHIRSRGEEAKDKQKQPGKKARRWVVERTHGWMNRFRSILTHWCKKERNYLGMLYFVCGLISYRAAGLFG